MFWDNLKAFESRYPEKRLFWALFTLSSLKYARYSCVVRGKNHRKTSRLRNPVLDTLRLMWSECDADKIIILGEDTLPKDFLPECEMMHRVIENAIEERKKYGENELTYVVVK